VFLSSDHQRNSESGLHSGYKAKNTIAISSGKYSKGIEKIHTVVLFNQLACMLKNNY
jgi:hypothetical protein